MVMAPPSMCDSAASPCLHGCPASLHRHLPPQSPLSHPLDLSLHSQQQPLPWYCSTIPIFQLPAAIPSRGPVQGMYGCGKDCLFSFHLDCHRSAVSLSAFNVSPLTQRVAPMWGSDPASVPHRPPGLRAGPVLLTLLFFPPSSFVLSSFAWVYMFFFSLSWCSACTSVSEGVFLMYLWREMYSTTTSLLPFCSCLETFKA